MYYFFCVDYEAREATRLLLLDERYKDKLKDELPQAVQVCTPLSFFLVEITIKRMDRY